MCSVALHSSENMSRKKGREGSSDFRKPDTGISLPVGIPSVMCSPSGMGLPLFYSTEVCDASI